jgi:hypothetical protein
VSQVSRQKTKKKIPSLLWKEFPFFLIHQRLPAFIVMNLFLGKAPSVGTARPVRLISDFGKKRVNLLNGLREIRF